MDRGLIRTAAACLLATCLALPACAPRAAPSPPPPAPVTRLQPRELWRADRIDVLSVTTRADTIYALSESPPKSGSAAVLKWDRRGTSLGAVPLPMDISSWSSEFPPLYALRTASLKAPGSTDFIVYGPRAGLRAFASDGQLMWEKPGDDPAWDACPIDLDGDGLDEVLALDRRAASLHALDADGDTRWSLRIPGARQLAAATAPHTVTVYIACTAPSGIHVLDRAGSKVVTLPPPGGSAAPEKLALAFTPASPTPMFIANRGTSANLNAVSLDGDNLWSYEAPGSLVPSTFVMHQSSTAPNRPWLALATSRGVSVHDTRSGALLVHIESPGCWSLAWLAAAPAGPPLLAIAEPGVLRTIQIEPP